MADQNMKTRNYMYSQIISQLQNDGYGQIAQNLINQVKPDKLYQPSSKLFEVYKNEIGKVNKKFQFYKLFWFNQKVFQHKYLFFNFIRFFFEFVKLYVTNFLTVLNL